MEMFCVLNATVFTTGIDSCQQTANSTLKYVFLMISKLYYRQFHLQFFKKILRVFKNWKFLHGKIKVNGLVGNVSFILLTDMYWPRGTAVGPRWRQRWLGQGRQCLWGSIAHTHKEKVCWMLSTKKENRITLSFRIILEPVDRVWHIVGTQQIRLSGQSSHCTN